MPPPDDARLLPTLAEREIITGWVEKELYHYDPAHPDPGKVTLRRLNRAEYNATIRDLVGVDFKPAEDFPPDDSGYGFDNIGDVLSLPPILLEKYLAAADKILDQAIVTDPIKPMVRHIPASTRKSASTRWATAATAGCNSSAWRKTMSPFRSTCRRGITSSASRPSRRRTAAR
jgi:hypothetical protein